MKKIGSASCLALSTIFLAGCSSTKDCDEYSWDSELQDECLNVVTSGNSLVGIWVLAFVIAIFLNIIPARIARNKGYSFGGFWAFGWFFFVPALVTALLMQPKPGFVYTGISNPKKQSPETATDLPAELKCPQCAELIKTEARICRFCQTSVAGHWEALRADLSNQLLSERQKQEEIAKEEKLEQERIALASENQIREKRDQRASDIRKLTRSKLFWISIVALIGLVVGTAVWKTAEDNRIKEEKAALAIELTSSFTKNWETAPNKCNLDKLGLDYKADSRRIKVKFKSLNSMKTVAALRCLVTTTSQLPGNAYKDVRDDFVSTWMSENWNMLTVEHQTIFMTKMYPNTYSCLWGYCSGQNYYEYVLRNSGVDLAFERIAAKMVDLQ